MTTGSRDARAALLEQAIRRKREVASERNEQLPRRSAEREPELGEMQRGVWLHEQLDPGSSAYNLVSAFRTDGEVDVPAIEASLRHAVGRHRILRSTFRAQEDRVLQVIGDSPSIGVERIPASPGQATAVAAEEARKPFDLASGPLFRLLLIEVPGAAERLLVLILHHIVADERSLDLLWNELTQGHTGGSPETVAGAQFDDYVAWSREHGDERRAADLAFWQRHLEPLPEPLDLPFEIRSDRPPAARGRLLSRSLDRRQAERIVGLAAATGTTPFIVFAFAFRLLLQRYSEGRRIAFGTPASTRSHPATAAMIGYFLNSLVICVEIDEERPLDESIRAFNDRMRECLAHASLPFDRLVEDLSPPRNRDRHPLFQTMFVYQERPRPRPLGEARLEPLEIDLGAAKFDLTVFASNGVRSTEISVEYRADRFDEASMSRLLDHFATLLGNLEKGLGGTVAEVPMLAPEELQALDEAAQGAQLVDGTDALLPQRILDQVARSADCPAVTGAGASWSYSELGAQGRRIAEELVESGVEPGDRVGLYLERSPWMIAAIVGCHWAGAAYVPLDPSYPESRNRQVLEDADVAVLLTSEALASGSSLDAPSTIAVDGLQRRATEPAEAWPKSAAELPAYLLYTSGSTGVPKGVEVTHRNLAASTAARLDFYDLPPRRFLLLPSVAFDSSVAGIFWTLATGGELVIPSDDEVRDPRRLAELIAERRVTMLLAVPSLYVYLLELGADRLQSLEAVIVAGENCPQQLVREHFRRLPKVRLFNEYGPTEATVWVTVEEIRPPGGERGVAVGRPIPGARVDLLDSRGRPVPVGVPGEAWISGPTVARGYWRRPELTEERFVRRIDVGGRDRRTYRSGDRMTRTADGRLFFRGRVDEQIKLRGFRIEPGEIESALLENGSVEQATVVLKDASRLIGFVVADGVPSDWRERLRAALPDHMIPSLLIRLSDLPRLPNGKVDRRHLQEMELEEAPLSVERSTMNNECEKELAELWEALLETSGIGPHDNFFQIGGHSLLVIEMSLAIEARFGISIAPAEIFQHPTVRELAARLAPAAGAGSLTGIDSASFSHLFPLERGGRQAPFVFCIPHFFSALTAERFRGERAVYGLRGVGLRPEGNRGRWKTMRELGEELVEEIDRGLSGRPVVLAGYSFGATMAFETARLLERRGTPARSLHLIAPMPLDQYHLGPFRFQIDGLCRPVGEIAPAEALRRFARANSLLTLRPYRRAWRLLAVQSWRRGLCAVGRLRTSLGMTLTLRILHADVRLERFRLHSNYRPEPVKTPTVIFNASEPATDAAATWRPWFRGPLVVQEIPDPHLGEESIAAAWQQILDRWRDPEGV